MQAYTKDWDQVLSELFVEHLFKAADNDTKMDTGIIELNTRVNFRFNEKKYYSNRNESVSAGSLSPAVSRSSVRRRASSVSAGSPNQLAQIPFHPPYHT